MPAVYGLLLIGIAFITGSFYRRATRGWSDHKAAVKTAQGAAKLRWGYWRTALLMLAVLGLVIWMVMTGDPPSKT
jgi:hypothetical protein